MSANIVNGINIPELEASISATMLADLGIQSTVRIFMDEFEDLPPKELGPFGLFARAVYDDGYAGQVDRASMEVVYKPGVPVVTREATLEDITATFLRSTEYGYYESLEEAGEMLDKNPHDKAAMNDFVSSLSWIIYLGNKRDASQNLMDDAKMANLTSAMETAGIEKVNVVAFVKVLTSASTFQVSPENAVTLLKAKL